MFVFGSCPEKIRKNIGQWLVTHQLTTHRSPADKPWQQATLVGGFLESWLLQPSNEKRIVCDNIKKKQFFAVWRKCFLVDGLRTQEAISELLDVWKRGGGHIFLYHTFLDFCWGFEKKSNKQPYLGESPVCLTYRNVSKPPPPFSSDVVGSDTDGHVRWAASSELCERSEERWYSQGLRDFVSFFRHQLRLGSRGTPPQVLGPLLSDHGVLHNSLIRS